MLNWKPGVSNHRTETIKERIQFKDTSPMVITMFQYGGIDDNLSLVSGLVASWIKDCSLEALNRFSNLE